MNVDIKESLEAVKNSDEAVKLTKTMDKMINIKKNSILIIAYKKGKIFRKFKTDNKFISAVSTFRINKKTINFKIGIVGFIDKYPKMQKSCISL